MTTAGSRVKVTGRTPIERRWLNAISPTGEFLVTAVLYKSSPKYGEDVEHIRIVHPDKPQEGALVINTMDSDYTITEVK